MEAYSTEVDDVELSTQQWTVELLLSEKDGRSYAEARLHSGLARPLTASGEARLSSRDPIDVAEIGYELAAARALVRLGQALLRTADADVDELLRQTELTPERRTTR
jgi:hypothetical protein